jgi:hypothetical protein
MARTAVVAGTATAVAGGVSRHQHEKAAAAANAEAQQAAAQQAAIDAAVAEQLAAQQAATAPAPAPAASGPTDEVIGQLKQLGELRDAGILTDEEFAAKKAQLLGI